MNPTQSPITPRAYRAFRNAVTFLTLALGILAAIYSFNGLFAWYGEHGNSGVNAFILPVLIDGATLLASGFYTFIGILEQRRSRAALAVVVIGAGVSVAGNVAHGFDGTWDSVVIHALGPLVLLASVEITMAVWKREMLLNGAEAVKQEKAEQKAQRAAQKARERLVEARTAVEAPDARDEVFKPAKSAPAKAVAKPDDSRASEVEKVIGSTEFEALMTTSPTNAEAARWLMDRVPGVTASEACSAGFLSDPDTDTAENRKGYMRVRTAFKSAEKSQADSARGREQVSDTTPVQRRLVAA